MGSGHIINPNMLQIHDLHVLRSGLLLGQTGQDCKDTMMWPCNEDRVTRTLNVDKTAMIGHGYKDILMLTRRR